MNYNTIYDCISVKYFRDHIFFIIFVYFLWNIKLEFNANCTLCFLFGLSIVFQKNILIWTDSFNLCKRYTLLTNYLNCI
jgi:hypothetical protein